jgi:hypothetical protein
MNQSTPLDLDALALAPQTAVLIDMDMQDFQRATDGAVQGRVFSLSFAHDDHLNGFTIQARQQSIAPPSELPLDAKVSGRASTPLGHAEWDACTVDRVPPESRGSLVFVRIGGCSPEIKAANVESAQALGMAIFGNVAGQQPPETPEIEEFYFGNMPIMTVTLDDAAILLQGTPWMLISTSKVEGAGRRNTWLWHGYRELEWPYLLSVFTPVAQVCLCGSTAQLCLKL